MEFENYNKKDLTISFGAANFYAVIYVLPAIIILFLIYWFVWGNILISFNYAFLLILLVGIFAHELIHGLVAIGYSENGIKSIKFGISWKFLTPYCHCKDPLTVKEYRIVLLSPLIILGIIPSVIGFIFGNNEIYFFGLLYILAAGGDLVIFRKLQNERKDSFVLDHEDKCGCLVYVNPGSDEKIN